MKSQAVNWEYRFATHLTNKGLIIEIYIKKKLLQISNKKANDLIGSQQRKKYGK